MAEAEVAKIGLPTKGSNEEAIAQSIIPYSRDDDKARYLGLRACGFTIREALHLIGKAKSTLSQWRHDSTFKSLEDRIPEFSHQLGVEYANLEFLRNYRLVLEKDYRVLTKALDKKQELSQKEHDYLLKLRAYYTPQQLEVLETLAKADLEGKNFNFTEFIITATRTEQRVRLEAKSEE